MPKTAQLLAGIVILTIACWLAAYAGLAITVITLGILGGVGQLVSIGLPLLVATLLFRRGKRGGKLGCQWAPVVFFGGWTLVSVAMRGYLSLEAAKLAPAQINPNIAGIKTLVVDDFLNVSRTFVSEGVIDQLVEIAYTDNNRSKPIRSIRQTTLARDLACTDEDKARSFQLRAVGRIEECLKETELTTVPDGLHILYPVDHHWGPNRPGELRAWVVENGRRTEALKWRRISARVPAYAPVFKMNMGPFNRTQTIWETRTGPFEVVSFGDVDLTSEAMAAAIYGFDPSLPPQPKIADRATLAERASELASSGDYAAALAIVTLLDKANFLDDNMIRVAGYSILAERNGLTARNRLPDLGRFADKLNLQQNDLLNDEIIRILTTSPNKCRCRAFLFNSTELGQRAIDAFMSVSGLELWQYEGLLSATMYVATPFEEHRRKLFASIVASHDASNAGRIVAYLNQAGFRLLDEELQALTPKLAELNDEGIFLIATHSVRVPSPSQVKKYHKTFDPEVAVTGDTWNAFWTAMRSHAARISDPDQRARAIEQITNRQLES